MEDGSPVKLDAEGRVASPCIGVCRMDRATGWCEGCWRSIEEIASWGMASESEKREIWARIARRRSKDGIL